MMESSWHDLRYGVRVLWRNPGTATLALITLGLGIGANSAIFSLVSAVLLAPLPYHAPSRLVQVWEKSAQANSQQTPVSVHVYSAWKDQSKAFECLSAYRNTGFTITGRGDPERIFGVLVSAQMFECLGVAPVLGRGLRTEDTQGGSERVVVVSHGFWTRILGGNQRAVGDKLVLNGSPYTIIGVMPRGFEFPIQADKAQLWAPLVFRKEELLSGSHTLFVIGRLAARRVTTQARAELEAIQRRDSPPTSDAPMTGVMVAELKDEVVHEIRPALWMLFGSVSFVLLIACVNIANLLMARALSRHREFSIRAALGASRHHLIKQLLTENVVLSLSGAGLGLLLASISLNALSALSPVSIPRVDRINIDTNVLVFTLSVSLLTQIVFGIVPTLRLSKVDIAQSLKEGGSTASWSFSGRRLADLLIVGELALALALLIGAGLMIKSLLKLGNVDAGIAEPRNILTFSVSLSRNRFPGSQQQVAFYQQLLERVSSLPDVEAVGATGPLPVTGGAITDSFTIEGSQPSVSDAAQEAGVYPVTPDYFRTLGIPIIKGRSFTALDQATSLAVVLVNQTLARQGWSGKDPLGKRLRIAEGPWCQVVGVVGDTKRMSLDVDTPPEIYQPYTQAPVGSMSLVVRTNARSPHAILPAIRGQILDLNPQQPISSIRTMEEVFDASTAHPRFRGVLLSVFACLALILSACGLYSVVSYSVSLRTREIGTRMALGAHPAAVVWMVLKQGMILTIEGIIIGLLGSFALTRLLRGFLFQVSPVDPEIYLGLALLFALVTLIASYFPARRAALVDPVVALRSE